MLLNFLVSWLMPDMKCHTKNVFFWFFLSKKAVSHMTFVNCPTGQPLSIKVKIFHLQWAAPWQLLTIAIFFTKGKG